MTGIYAIINKVDFKIYIGQAKNIKLRFNNHKHSLRNDKHKNLHLQRAWNQYGEDNFEFMIIELCDYDLLNDKEIKFIKNAECLNDKYGYNFLPGGKNSPHTPETKRKISKANKGKEPWNRGITHSEETKKLLSEKSKGLPGYWNGKHHSEESKLKMSESHKGKKRAPHSEETKAKMRESYRNRIKQEVQK